MTLLWLKLIIIFIRTFLVYRLQLCSSFFNIHNGESDIIANLNDSFVSSLPFTLKAFRKLLKDDTVFIATLCKVCSSAKLRIYIMEQNKCSILISVLDCASKSVLYLLLIKNILVFIQLPFLFILSISKVELAVDVLFLIGCYKATIPLFWFRPSLVQTFAVHSCVLAIVFQQLVFLLSFSPT